MNFSPIIRRILFDLVKSGLPPLDQRDYNPQGKMRGERGGRFDPIQPGTAHFNINKSRKSLLKSFQTYARKNGVREGVGEALDYLMKESNTPEEINHIAQVAKAKLRKDLGSLPPKSKSTPVERSEDKKTDSDVKGELPKPEIKKIPEQIKKPDVKSIQISPLKSILTFEYRDLLTINSPADFGTGIYTPISFSKYKGNVKYDKDQITPIEIEYSSLKIGNSFFDLSKEEREKALIRGIGEIIFTDIQELEQARLTGLNTQGPFGSYGDYIFNEDSVQHAFGEAFRQYYANPDVLYETYPDAYQYVHNRLTEAYKAERGTVTLPELKTPEFEIQKKRRKYIHDEYELPYGAELHTLKSGKMFYYPIESEYDLKTKGYKNLGELTMIEQEARRRIDKMWERYRDGETTHEPWTDSTDFESAINRYTKYGVIESYFTDHLKTPPEKPLDIREIDRDKFDSLFDLEFKEGIRDIDGKLVAIPYNNMLILRGDRYGDMADSPESTYKRDIAVIKEVLFKDAFADQNLSDYFAHMMLKDFAESNQYSYAIREYIESATPVTQYETKVTKFLQLFGDDQTNLVRSVASAPNKSLFLASQLARYYAGTKFMGERTIDDSIPDLANIIKTRDNVGSFKADNLSLVGSDGKSMVMDFKDVISFKNEIEGIQIDPIIHKMDGSITYRCNFPRLGKIDIRHVSDTRQRLDEAERFKKYLYSIQVDPSDIDILYDPKSDKDERDRVAKKISPQIIEEYKKVKPDAPETHTHYIIDGISSCQWGGYYSYLGRVCSDIPDDFINPSPGEIIIPRTKNKNGALLPTLYVDDTFVSLSPEQKINYLKGIANKRLADTFLESRELEFNEELKSTFKDEATLREDLMAVFSNKSELVPDSRKLKVLSLIQSPDGHPKCYYGPKVSTEFVESLYPESVKACDEPEVLISWREVHNSYEFVSGEANVKRLQELFEKAKKAREQRYEAGLEDDEESLKKERDLYLEYVRARHDFENGVGGEERRLWRQYYDNYCTDEYKEGLELRKSELNSKLQKQLFTSQLDISPQFITDPADSRFRKPDPDDKYNQIPISENLINDYNKKVGPKVIDFLNKRVHPDLWNHISLIVTGTNSDRSFHSNFGASESISISHDGMCETTFIHEYGHVIESCNKKVHEVLIKFLKLRMAGEKEKKLSEWTGNSSYEEHERATKDHFPDVYCGKNYGGSSTELLSMGLQYMYSDPSKFLYQDPEYFQLIYDIMQGVYND